MTDADIGINAEVDFAITAGSQAASNHFSVTSTGTRIADLRIISEFDREAIDFFSFTITVTDRGSPSLTDTIFRCINIIVRYSVYVSHVCNNGFRTSMTVYPPSILWRTVATYVRVILLGMYCTQLPLPIVILDTMQ